MFSLRENKVNGDKIVRWEVWWMTPVGVTPDRQQALDRMRELDLDADLVVKPVPVAITEKGHEVVI